MAYYSPYDILRPSSISSPFTATNQGCMLGHPFIKRATEKHHLSSLSANLKNFEVMGLTMWRLAGVGRMIFFATSFIVATFQPANRFCWWENDFVCSEILQPHPVTSQVFL